MAINLPTQFTSTDSTYYLSGGTLCGPIVQKRVADSWTEIRIRFVGKGPFNQPHLLVASAHPGEQHVALPLRSGPRLRSAKSFSVVINGEKASHDLFVIPSLQSFELRDIDASVLPIEKGRAALAIGINLVLHPMIAFKSFQKANNGYTYRAHPERTSWQTKVRLALRAVMNHLPDPDSLDIGPDPAYTRWLNEKYEHLIPRTTSLGVVNDGRFGAVLRAHELGPELFRTLNSLRSAGISSENIILLADEPLDLSGLDWPLTRLAVSETPSVFTRLGTFSHLIALRPGDIVSRSLLQSTGNAESQGLADVIYFDSDTLDREGHVVEHDFKPDPSPVTILFNNYIDRGAFVACRLIENLLAALPDLRALDCESITAAALVAALRDDEHSVIHVSQPLIQLQVSDARSTASSFTGQRLARDLICKKVVPGLDITLKAEGTATWTAKTNSHKSVTILIPTRDRVDLLKPALESILAHTDYPGYSVLVIDNQSQESATRKYLSEVSDLDFVSVTAFDAEFNYARMHNETIKDLNTDLVMLLNNDTEVTDSSWLADLIALFEIPGVGIVGNKLVYPDQTIQHVGAIGGLNGPMSHPLVGMHQNSNHRYMKYPRDVLAVTGACLMIARSDYLEVGGMDEVLAVSYNDMDLCLKMRSTLQKSVVVSSSGGVIHKESKSRGQHFSENVQRLLNEEADYFEKKWYSQIHPDPFYNPNLSLRKAFELGS